MSPDAFLRVAAGHVGEERSAGAMGIGSQRHDSRAQAMVDIPQVIVAGKAWDGPVDGVHVVVIYGDELGWEAFLSYIGPSAVCCHEKVIFLELSVAEFVALTLESSFEITC